MARIDLAGERLGASAASGIAAVVLSLAVLGGAAEAQEAAVSEPSVVLEADTVINDEENQLVIAEGRVEARYGERLLRADRLVYDIRRGSVRAIGSVELIDASGDVQFAEEIEVDDQLNVGVATGFSSRLENGGTVAAGAAVRRPDGSLAMRRLVYTACPICKTGEGSPTWTLRARRAVQDKERDLIVYRDAVLRLKGVPVLYLPYFAHPDPSVDRKSGLLPPSIGRNSRTGAFASQPYLWTVDPSTDFTVAPQAFTRVNPLLNLDLRRRFYSGSAQFSGSITYERDFDNTGARFGEREVRGHVFGTGAFQIDEKWRWGFGLARVTDDLFLRRYEIPGAEARRGIYGGDITRLFSQVNVVRQTPNSYTEISGISVQGLRFDDNDATTPTVLPLSDTEHVLRDPLLKGQLRLQGSSAVLLRDDGQTDSARVSAGLRYEVSRTIGPGVLVTPFLHGRSDAYRLDEAGQDEELLVRTVGLAGVEARWPFVRPGSAVDLLIEPVAFAAIGTADGNNPDIVNEDSIGFEVDESALFRPNAAPNFDLFEPGARASFGLRAAATTDRGSVTAIAGRRWRAEGRPDLFNPQANLEEGFSDWVGGVDADFQNVEANVRVRLDDDFELQRIDATASARFWRVSANARYLNVAEEFSGLGPSAEVSGGLNLQLTRRWSTGYSLRRDLDRDTNLSQGALLRYQDDCSFFEFSYVRNEVLDRALGPSTVFAIRVGLSTLGVIGSPPR